MRFDNLYENTHRKNTSGAGKLRMFCIFILVAGVTALAIWKMIPSAPEKQPAPGEPEQKQLQQSATPENKEENNKTSSETPPASEQETKGAVAPEVGSDSAERPSQTEAIPERGGENAPSAKPETTPPLPEAETKGIVVPGDIPAEKDKPFVPPESKFSETAALQDLEKCHQEKNFAESAARAGALLEKLTSGSEAYRKALHYLTQTNWQRFLGRDTRNGFGILHTVAPGEYLGRITRKNKTTIAAVAKTNKLRRSGNIIIGQKLFLLPGEWQITVSKKKRLLELSRNGKIFMGFDVGIGRKGKTPNADFVISDRLKHPTYVTTDGRVFKHGEEGNELGDYFLKLASSGKPDRPLSGYGIHGTPDETTVTRSVSNGCIRMRNADVEKLYYIVPVGTPVVIRD